MRLKKLFVVSALSLSMVLNGCGKTSDKAGDSQAVTPTEVVADEVKPEEGQPTDEVQPGEGQPNDGDTVEEISSKAKAAYQEILDAAPGLKADTYELVNDTMNYEQNKSKFGDHIESYAIIDLNDDEIPELIALTSVNYKWRVFYVYTYSDGKAVLLNNPLDSSTNGSFEQNASASYTYFLSICEKNHLHNIKYRIDEHGQKMEEEVAYSVDGTSLSVVECNTAENAALNYYEYHSKENVIRESTTDSDETNQIVTSVDFYQIPDLYCKILTTEEIEFYKKFVTAWLNYEPSIDAPNSKVTRNLWGLVQECFLVGYGDFDEKAGGFLSEGTHITFNYLSTSKEEHDEYIKAFEDRVLSFYHDIDASETGVELMKHIYYNFNQTIDYDYVTYENKDFSFNKIGGYTALMKGTGVCVSFGRAYSYLLRQAGFEAFDVSGQGPVEGHEWSALKIGEKYYFADPTWDYIKDPYAYSYFCFGMDQREADGYPENTMHFLCNGELFLKDHVTIERGNLFE